MRACVLKRYTQKSAQIASSSYTSPSHPNRNKSKSKLNLRRVRGEKRTIIISRKEIIHIKDILQHIAHHDPDTRIKLVADFLVPGTFLRVDDAAVRAAERACEA